MPRGVPKAGFRVRKNQEAGQMQTFRMNPIARPIVETMETDQEIDEKLRRRFKILATMTKSVARGDARAMIVSGPPGLGKSFTVEKIIREYDPMEKKTVMVKGFIRASGLYKILHQYSKPGNVVIFDDCDSVFDSADTLNLLKTASDTTDRRRLTWGAETRMTDDDGAALPWSFDFEGSIIFITNIDFDYAVQTGGRMSEHFEAMISRSHYIDTGMKSKRDYLVRIKQVVAEGMLAERGFTKQQEKEIVDYVFQNSDRFRELTLRLVVKLGSLYKSSQKEWKDIAETTLFRQ